MSDQVLFKTFLQSHISQLSSLRTSSFLKFHDSAPYRRVLKQKSALDVSLCNSLLQAKSEGFCQQFFLLSKRVLCSGYSRSNFFLTGPVLCNTPKKDRKFLTRPLTDCHHLSLLNIDLQYYPALVGFLL